MPNTAGFRGSFNHPRSNPERFLSLKGYYLEDMWLVKGVYNPAIYITRA